MFFHLNILQMILTSYNSKPIIIVSLKMLGSQVVWPYQMIHSIIHFTNTNNIVIQGKDGIKEQMN